MPSFPSFVDYFLHENTIFECEYTFEEYMKYEGYFNNINFNTINENTLPKPLQKVVEFFKKLGNEIKLNFSLLIEKVKGTLFYKIMSKFDWDFLKIKKFLKYGEKLYDEFEEEVVKAYEDTKEINIKKIQNYLDNHPIAKHITGFALAALMAYIWMYVITFTGHIDFDFDQSDLINAFLGNYDLCDIFCGTHGDIYIYFVLTGAITGISFPYPGEVEILFVISLLYTIGKKEVLKMKNTINTSVFQNKIDMYVKQYMPNLQTVKVYAK